MDIIELLSVLSQCLDKTSVRRLCVIVPALLSMSGRITMLGISRWTEEKGSYRTIQRFYNTSIPWGMALWIFFQTYLYQAEQEYLRVGDESVVTKAGKETHGLDCCYSSLFSKPVKGLAFMSLSVVSISERKSYPLQVEQMVRSDAEKSERTQKKCRKASKKASKPKGKSGRPKGGKSKDKRQIEWTAELSRVARMAIVLLKRMGAACLIRYFVLDGHFGNNNVMQMVRQWLGLHLISKLRNDSALYFLYDGEQKAKGRKPIYGAKLDYQCIPNCYRVSSTSDNTLQTDIYQATMLHKSFAEKLNVVIMVKTNLATQKRAHVVLFSSDLNLGFAQLVDFYRLRFQIEFNFRDAKQFWGFEDFMNIKQTSLNNAVGLAFFMVNLSALLVQQFRLDSLDFGILDLKAHFRSRRFLAEVLKLLPDSVDTIVLHDLWAHSFPLGTIHSHKNPSPLP